MRPLVNELATLAIAGAILGLILAGFVKMAISASHEYDIHQREVEQEVLWVG